ncbi:hypothetical protein D9V32_13530 [Mycetocola tolaasinivorans]|uniref:Uncharacterized protein n=1 Tax=Mycetocola tolaasinivorans TaxID=76635 RepID=A0A3L7A2R6_9MICO|nr:hypothetical protein [Mycetocola tolaasinivorans]RLP74364.1 hypothetical protein D9V32_13530 [Mycetocola tolaasinivorans]
MAENENINPALVDQINKIGEAAANDAVRRDARLNSIGRGVAYVLAGLIAAAAGSLIVWGIVAIWRAILG